MSANYFQASRLGNKSQKDEVNGMSRGARDRGAEQAGGGGSLWVQAPAGGVFISAPRPSAQVPALAPFIVPPEKWPLRSQTSWLQVRNSPGKLPGNNFQNHGVGGMAIFMSLSHHRISWLFPHHKGIGTIALVGKQEVWAPNSLWGPQTSPSLL